MRKVRDYDAELKALNDKARSLKAKRVEQLGQLVAATGADALDAETLAGGLLHVIAEAQIAGNREAWRSDGAAFFQRRGRKGGGAAAIDGSGTTIEPGGDAAGGSNATANG
ncbi:MULTISPECIES: conjugal transfer protein TraD [Sphingomonadaceae]|jgi:hypothetical protein|uniref:Conjugal transfer protein TraD n=1 Tax=Sphingobium fuliginis (strain ATCC 27551) TaxID=336203 RepID=A0A292Z9G6_SPHSA|nr:MULTISPECIES: conjugal transfer protein TraD [Sphingomonadaceae]GAY19513.1 hypothetical protein SFOMI_0032 [Sphingobium fuliginis]